MAEKSIESLINRGYNVIYDATNLKASYINKIANTVRHTAKIEYQIFDVPIGVAIQRDDVRERKVGKQVIEKQYQQYLTLLGSFDFASINPIPKKYIAPKFDPSKELAYLFDIDGTLAHTSGKRSPYDYEKVEDDDVDLIVKNLSLELRKLHKIVIVSGRDESCRSETERWLFKNNIQYNELFMRKTGDSRKDSIIKEEIFWEHIEPNYNVLCVFDDIDQVVKMWRSLGIKCLQVESGNF